MNRLAFLLALFSFTTLLAACGDEACPEGTADFGEGCVPTDAGVDGDAGDGGDADACVMSPEECNGLDDDCDGTIDEGLDENTFYPDADEDTYGGEMVTACAAPPGHVVRGGDCDDADDGIHPGVAETCDDVDQDCDGAVDEGRVGPVGVPVPLGETAEMSNSTYDVAIAPTVDGYAIAYFLDLRMGTDYDVMFERLDSNGARVDGSAQSLALAGWYDARDVDITVLEIGDTETALVAWSADYQAFARSLEVAGSLNGEAQDLGGGTELRLIAAGDEIAAVSNGGSEINARAIDPNTAAPVGPSEVLLSDWLLDAPQSAGTFAPPLLLIGHTDQLPGDTVNTGYLMAFTVGGRPGRVGEPVEAQPEAMTAMRSSFQS